MPAKLLVPYVSLMDRSPVWDWPVTTVRELLNCTHPSGLVLPVGSSCSKLGLVTTGGWATACPARARIALAASKVLVVMESVPLLGGNGEICRSESHNAATT